MVQSLRTHRLILVELRTSGSLDPTADRSSVQYTTIIQPIGNTKGLITVYSCKV